MTDSDRTSRDADEPWAVVERMLGHWHAMDPAAILACFHEDAVMHNMMREPLEGKAAIAGLLDFFFSKAGHVEMEIVSRAVSGNTVMVERLDSFSWDGKPGLVPFVGVFEVEDGLIRRWREYFDEATYVRQVKG